MSTAHSVALELCTTRAQGATTDAMSAVVNSGRSAS